MVVIMKGSEVRRERFLRIKERRLLAVKKTLEGVGKLSVRSNHDYRSEDVMEITKFLSKEVYSVINKFSASSNDRLKYYIQAELEHYDYLRQNDKELYELMKTKLPQLSDFWEFLEKDKNPSNEESSLDSLKDEILSLKEDIQSLKYLLQDRND